MLARRGGGSCVVGVWVVSDWAGCRPVSSLRTAHILRLVTLLPISLLAVVPLGGCAAEAPSLDPHVERAPPEARSEAPPRNWSDSLDEAVFGAGAGSRRERRDPAPQSASATASDRASGDPEAAIEEFEREYAQAPDSEKAKYLRLLEEGLDRRLRGSSNEEILEYIENKVQTRSGVVRGFYTRLLALGLLAKVDGDPRELILFFAEKAENTPSEVRWIYRRMLADRRLSLHENEAAKSDYETLLGEIPQEYRADPSLYGNLAVTYYRLGRLEEARKAARQALVMDEKFPEGLKTLGLIELRAGRAEEGIGFLQKAVAGKKALPEAQIALAEHDEEAGRPEMALERYQYLLATVEAPDFSDPFYKWSYLFPGTPGSVVDELRGRIRRLKGRGPVSKNENPAAAASTTAPGNRKEN